MPPNDKDDDGLQARLAESDEIGKTLQQEIDSVREDVQMNLEQVEALVSMYRKLLYRVDIIDRHHKDVMAENVQLRAALLTAQQDSVAKDAEIEALKKQLADLTKTDKTTGV